MTDDKAPRSIHITGYASHSVSTDGTTAMIVFEIADGGHFAITLPVEHLNAVRTGISALIDKVVNRGGNALPRFLTRFDVGHSDDIGSVKLQNGNSFAWRDLVILRFDGDTEDEVTYIFTKKDGLQMADALNGNIKPRLTMQERREWLTKETLKLPQKKGIIVP